MSHIFRFRLRPYGPAVALRALAILRARGRSECSPPGSARQPGWLLLAGLALAGILPGRGGPASGSPAPRRAASAARVQAAYGRLPLTFEANRGQTDARVKFLSRGPGYSLYLTGREAVLALQSAKGKEQSDPKTEDRKLKAEHRTPKTEHRTPSAVLRMRLAGANPQPKVVGEATQAGIVNYFRGRDPKQWRTNIPTYGKVRCEGVYPGVDLVYYGSQSQLEYDFIVAPGADPQQIRLSIEGAERAEVDTRGDLVLRAAGREVRQRRPVIYQEIDGRRNEVAGGYALDGRRQVRFRLGRYDTRRPLVIDPVLVYSTFLGGTAHDTAWAVAVDSSGSAYVTGSTLSLNFPTTPGAFDPTFNGAAGDRDVFVSKLNPGGTALVYSTYLGGSSSGDYGLGIAVDGSGSAYVTGPTSSAMFPTTPGAFDPTFNGGADTFVTKLAPTGAALVYSTYLGGTGSDAGEGIAVDSTGGAYVTGLTTSSDFPTTAGAFSTTLGAAQEAFVTKLTPTGAALDYSTYLGGTGSRTTNTHAIAVDSLGSAYVTGDTNNFDFPTTPGAFSTSFNGFVDAFVTKLTPTGAALDYSTYLGGSVVEQGNGIAVDPLGCAYVTGFTTSPGFPATAGAFDTTYNGGQDVFVTKLDSAGAALVYSTFLGDTLDDIGNAIAVDSTGSAYVTGLTLSSSFPTTPGAFDTTFNGGTLDAFVTALDPSGGSLAYSTYLGGSGGEIGYGIALDSLGSAYVAGETGSTNFPTTAGAFQTGCAGDSDAFVTKLSFRLGPPATLTLSPAADTNPVGQNHCVTATVQDASGNPTPNITVRFAVTGVSSTGGSATTDASGQATFCYHGPSTPGADTITAYADTDGDSIQDPGEPGGAATKTWVAGNPVKLALAPKSETNPVSTQHCVTATVQDAFGNPTPGITVRFSVSGSVTTSGTATTNGAGQATFCYTGPPLPGADLIAAFADTNNSGSQEAGEPGDTADKVWAVPDSSLDVKTTGGGWIVVSGVQATFGLVGKVSQAGAPSGDVSYDDHAGTKVKSTSITSVVVLSPTKASIYGKATVNGAGSFDFVVNVEDKAEPGAGADTFSIQFAGYARSGTLAGGNIQVHK